MNTTIITKVSIGDTIYSPYHDGPLTVGQVRVCITDSKGINGGYVERISVAFDNYKPQKEYKEEYMCEETGIGSGSIFTWGESAFLTKEEAVKAREAREANQHL